MFKIISCGWQCAQFLDQTIASVLTQERKDWEMQVIYDLSTDGGECALWAWDRMDRRINVACNDQQNFAAHNQWEALQLLYPEDDDIVIWLDLDGDQFAHPNVLNVVESYYQDDTLLTYGSYRAVPEPPEPPRIMPYPDDVVASNRYRQDALYNGPRFNHLRTMKGKVAKSIPEDLFKWPDGSWYVSGQDYIFMLAGLERAGGRYKVIPDILHIYNDANPLADNKAHGQETHKCDLDFMSKPPLERLP
jgi:hypothetical protein